jgi:multicomponent Na+:H+ antiporter subunit F
MYPELLLDVSLAIIVSALFVTLYRVVTGPTLADRVVAIDLIGASAVCLMVAAAARSQEAAFLDVAVVIALLGFLGTVAYARFTERRGGN